MSNHDQLRLVFLGGGGGSWLSNLIWHLKNQDWTIPTVSINFDQEPQGVLCDHGLDPSHYAETPTVIFSTRRLFNLYLNHVKKISYPIHQIDSKPEASQICTLADHAEKLLTDAELQQSYFSRVDLDYELIFLDQYKFINDLYDILDQAKITYTKNSKYILYSMANYRSTCEQPTKYIGTDTVEWLGFCLAVARVKNISVQPFDMNLTLDDVKTNFNHVQDLALEFVQTLYFDWQP
jgi:hypothetical protein